MKRIFAVTLTAVYPGTPLSGCILAPADGYCPGY
jgi:hypothetical protein